MPFFQYDLYLERNHYECVYLINAISIIYVPVSGQTKTDRASVIDWVLCDQATIPAIDKYANAGQPAKDRFFQWM